MSNEYPKWKIVGWRALRAFVWGFISSLALSIQNLELENLDKVLAVSVLTGALTAGGQALFKAIREYFFSDDPTNLVNKLPL